MLTLATFSLALTRIEERAPSTRPKAARRLAALPKALAKREESFLNFARSAF